MWKETSDAVRNSYAKDEQDHLSYQLKEMQIAAKNNQLGRTWEIINTISGKSKPKVKRLDGSIPNTEIELLDDWAIFFEKLLNAEQSSQ